ncbi:MAG: glycosyltransferase family 4 protein, partial [Patescibacteria group bacterium]
FVLSFIGGDLYDPTKGVSPHRHPVLRAVVRWVADQAAICTAISEDTKWRAYEMHGVDKDVVVTHLGLIPHAVVTVARKDVNLPEGVPIFVSVGRLIPRKRYDLLLEAWREIPSAHLVIIGDGPLKEDLQSKIAAYGLEKRVHLLGFVDEAHKYKVLQASDAYISATEHEGFGIVYLEAMEAGLPIVTTDTGGQRDFLTEAENAILVATSDAKQLVAGMQRLLSDEKLRQKMAVNNREKVKEFYLEKTAKKFEDVLTEAADKKV